MSPPWVACMLRQARSAILSSAKALSTFRFLRREFDPTDLKTEIIHSGGLRLAAGGTTVDLRHFIIDTTGAKPVITGLIVLDGKVVGRAALFDLHIKAMRSGPGNRSLVLVLRNVGVTLDSGAAATLNSVFHISALAGGLLTSGSPMCWARLPVQTAAQK